MGRHLRDNNICEKCGVAFVALDKTVKYCPEHRYYRNICQKCGVEFDARKIDSQYCGGHRYLSSPAYLAKMSKKVPMTPEQYRERTNVQKREWRLRHGVKPRLPKLPPQPALKERIIISTVINESRPEAPGTVKKEKQIPVDMFFLRVNAKTRYGFTDRARMDKFKSRHKDLFL